jgi:hypothetical protein
VLTSGSTTDECARVLRRAGALRVGVALVARAGDALVARTGTDRIVSRPS